MLKLIKYIILFIFLNGSLAAAKNQPSGIWVGKINCNHERSEFSLEIIENDINLQIAQQSYKGSASFERKNHLIKIKAKNSLDGNELIENLYFSVNGKTLTGKVKVNCNVSAYNSSFNYDKFMPINSNSVSVETYDKLSKAEVRLIQYDLRVLEYNPGIADGQIGPKTIRALSLFINDNNIISDEIFSVPVIKKLQSTANKKLNILKRQLPWPWRIQTNFEEKSDLRQFDLQRLQNCNFKTCTNGHAPTQILSESNGNQFLALTSFVGQLSNVNKNPADRNELGTKPIETDLEGVTVWYAFKVKHPSDKYEQAAKGINFNQIKEVVKIQGVKKMNCSKGVVFYMWSGSEPEYGLNPNNIPGVGIIARGDGLKFKPSLENIPLINSDWTTYKVGAKLSRKNGWLNVYQNGKLLWRSEGANLISQYYPECKSTKPNWRQAHLRIGVYRSLGPEGQDTLHFDDFVASHSEEDVDKFLKNSRLERKN